MPTRRTDLQPAALPVSVSDRAAAPQVAAQLVHDSRLGELLFPACDQVMAPWITRTGSWEVSEGWWLDHVLEPGMTFLNVGANVGYFAVWAAELVGARGQVLAVEPDPSNYALLRENVARRRLRNVTAYQAAASDAAGTLDLYVNPHNSGDHRVFDPSLTGDGTGFGSSPPQRLQVPAVPLDELVGDRRVDVVMTDTQGWDHHVLRGLRETMRTRRPVVLCEFTPTWIRRLGEEPYDVLAEFTEWGYAVGVPPAGVPAGRWDLQQILDYATHPTVPYATLELVPLDAERRGRAAPGQGFWRPEASGRTRRWWLTAEAGRIYVQGPANSQVDVDFQLLAPPGAAVDIVVDNQRYVVHGRPVPVSVPVQLDGRGLADIPVTPVSRWTRAPGDPRRLFAAVVEPEVKVR